MCIWYMVELFSPPNNQEREVPNSHKLKTIRQISPWNDLTHLWMGKITKTNRNKSLYFELYLKKLYTLYQATEGVENKK